MRQLNLPLVQLHLQQTQTFFKLPAVHSDTANSFEDNIACGGHARSLRRVSAS